MSRGLYKRANQDGPVVGLKGLLSITFTCVLIWSCNLSSPIPFWLVSCLTKPAFHMSQAVPASPSLQIKCHPGNLHGNPLKRTVLSNHKSIKAPVFRIHLRFPESFMVRDEEASEGIGMSEAC